MRTRIIFLSIAVFALPLLAQAAAAPKNFKELADIIFQLLASGVATLVALGIVIYLWGIASNMIKLSQGEGGAYRVYVFWGITIIFVMVSIFGIVRLIASTFFGSGNIPAQQQRAAPSSLLNGGI